MKRLFGVFFALLMIFSLVGCNGGGGNNKGDLSYTFVDDLGYEVTVTSAKRVITLSGSYAEIWCLAGGKDTIVATSDNTWTDFDLGLSEDVINVGAIKSPNTEAIYSAAGDLIICSCNTEANIELRDAFIQAGLTPIFFDVNEFEDYLRMLKHCTEITGMTENYKKYGTDIQSSIDEQLARPDGTHATVLCIRQMGSKWYVKGSKDYMLGQMLAELGTTNIADSDTSLTDNLSVEKIIQDDPDYVFIVPYSVDGEAGRKVVEETLFKNEAWASLRAVQEGRVIVLDYSLYGLKPNANWGKAYEVLADVLYPKTK